MANDLFGGLGNLFKGFMPKDDPAVKLMDAQGDIDGLRRQETEIYAEVGKKAMAEDAGRYSEYANRLRMVREEIERAEQALKAAQTESEAKKIEEAKGTCPECGHKNPEGTKFCQECGCKLALRTDCVSCGAAFAPGTRFCGACGAKQPEE